VRHSLWYNIIFLLRTMCIAQRTNRVNIPIISY